jgi:ubiquinone/menaquinone biosynthesis C-methylase UbiE
MLHIPEADMNAQHQTPFIPSFSANGGDAPANYERYFVPVIGEPMARKLLAATHIEPGQRILDLACGTGIVARLAVDAIGESGSVTGLDVNPGMLAVARSVASDSGIEWQQGNAESIPFTSDSFDVVLCQLGFQFFADKSTAMREVQRVLAPGGRVLLTVPGPTPELFAVMEAVIAQQISSETARFLDQVFSVHDAAEVQGVFEQAGLSNVSVEPSIQDYRLPAPAEFLWQYTYSTPLAGALANATPEQLAELEREVVEKWRPWVAGDGMDLSVRVLTASAYAN